jgi:TonB family protein
VMIGISCTPGWCATTSSRVRLDQPALAEVEDQLRRLPVHLSEFSPVSEPLALPRCGNVQPPEALVTPDPMLQFDEAGSRVRVSFIVGADGRVHSPFILDSGGTREDQVVLRAVGRWRYRPALCNGVPTDSEARIQFGIR